MEESFEVPIFHVKTDDGEILDLILKSDVEKYLNLKKRKDKELYWIR